MLSPELALEMRRARPTASPELRQRVLALAAVEAPPRRRFALPPLRRMALVAVPAAVAVALGGAVVHGLLSPQSPPRREAARPLTERGRAPNAVDKLGRFQPPPRRALSQQHGTFATGAVPTVPSRLQQYNAALRVQVRNTQALSDATKRAMRVARLLGGYVAAVQYSAPAHGRASAALVVRVPVDRVQDAIEEYAALGTIVGQNVRISDVTKAVQEEAKEIARLRADIARLEAGGVSPGERFRYDADKARLDFLTRTRAATVRRAELAKIWLGVVTKPNAAAAPAGRLHRTLDSAAHVLVRELEILLYAAIVAGPLLLLGGVAIGAARLGQRRRDAQLLERS